MARLSAVCPDGAHSHVARQWEDLRQHYNVNYPRRQSLRTAMCDGEGAWALESQALLLGYPVVPTPEQHYCGV
jgi:hypothetical protein